MTYKLNTLKKALNKLCDIRPNLKDEELYPWDDGKIYICYEGKNIELMEVFDKIYGTMSN